MNLIEELGIETARAIVGGAPVGATDCSNEDCEIVYYQKTNNDYIIRNVQNPKLMEQI